MDSIAEKANNIEFINVAQFRRQTLDKNIKALSRREAILRDSTITITHNKNGDNIIDELEKNWVSKFEQPPLIYWQDLEKLYVQFPNNDSKMEFLLHYDEKPTELFNFAGAAIDPINELTQQHITRRPVKCEIMNVQPRITTPKINKILNQLLHDGNKIITARDGKQHAVSKNRSVMFTVNAIGLRKIISEMDASIQYNQPAMKIRTKLNIKLNCKPWQCRKCFKLGRHECTGEICANCGLKGHPAKDCHGKKKHCSNCGKPGHRAKDTHCQIYQNEIIKELRRMDVPLEYMAIKEKRDQLINIIQFS